MSETQGKIAMFTGHRQIKDSKLLKQYVNEIVIRFINAGTEIFLCGGALGFDIIGGFAILDCKKKYPTVKLIVAAPCRNQDKLWSENNKAVYKKLLTAADEVVYVSEEYSQNCMKARNAYMVHRSDYCIAYLKIKEQERGKRYVLQKKKAYQYSILQTIHSLLQFLYMVCNET